MTFSRRSILSAAACLPVAACSQRVETVARRPAPAGGAAPLDLGGTPEEAWSIAAKAHEDLMMVPDLRMHGAEQIAMLVFPGMTMLDLVGPQYFFASMMGATIHLVSKDKTLAPVTGDSGFAIVPTLTMAECPETLDILFVPGGTKGVIDVLNDVDTIDFVASRGAKAKRVTSACTGALILGQAGLLEGRRATTHWAAHQLLAAFGATPVHQRVVKDGPVTTAAGVSAGIDLALALVAELRGVPYAEALQLQAEYAPEPPFNAGTPETIDPAIGGPLQAMFAMTLFDMKKAAANRRRAG